MKRILSLVLLSASLIAPSAHAAEALPYFDSLRAEVFNQLTIASNNIANDNDVKGNQKLIKTLQSTLKVMDKTKPDYASGSKDLGKLAKTFRRTAVSNEFNPLLETTLDVYLADLNFETDELVARVNGAYPGNLQNSAIVQLNKLMAALDAANTNVDLTAALKWLATAGKSIGKVEQAVIKAESAGAPPAEIVAQITGSENTSIRAIAGIVPGAGLILSGVQQAGAGVKQVNFLCENVGDGTHTVNVSSGSFNTLGTSGTKNYGNGTGTATVTRNNANQTAFGTFTFTAQGIAGTTGSVTVSGTFSGSW